MGAAGRGSIETPGSDLGWFSGDGPGPSLRGIMRGAGGALSGLGVFTRCAIKLYNWPGPPQIKTEGLLLDAQSEVPENMRFHLCFFPDRKKLADATYKIGESEIGYLFTRTAAATFMYGSAPNLFSKIVRTNNIKKLFSETLKWNFMIILMGSSKGDIDYQDTALKEILREHGGGSMEMMEIPVIGPLLVMNFLRVTAIPTIFRLGGLFTTALGRNETWDNQLDWADAGEKIRKRMISNDEILDDMGDNPFMALYENNMWAHCENIYQYDTRNEKHLKSLRRIYMESAVDALEKCMEPLTTSDPRQRKIFGPLMGNFHLWQKKISKALDPGRAADSGMYCDDSEYDFPELEPDLQERLDKIIKSFEQ